MNEFGRYTLIDMSRRFLKFVHGLRLQARAASGVDYMDDIAWRGSQGRPSARPALEGQTNVR